MDENMKNEIIISHIHPLKEDVIGLKATVAYHEKELHSVRSVLQGIMDKLDVHSETMKIEMQKNTSKIDRLWYLSVGGITVVIGVFAVFKWIVPLLGIGA